MPVGLNGLIITIPDILDGCNSNPSNAAMNNQTFLALNRKSGIFALSNQWYQCHRAPTMGWRVVEDLYRSMLLFAKFQSWPFTQDLPCKDVGCTEREILGGAIWWRNRGSEHVATGWMLSVCLATSERPVPREPFWGKL